MSSCCDPKKWCVNGWLNSNIHLCITISCIAVLIDIWCMVDHLAIDTLTQLTTWDIDSRVVARPPDDHWHGVPRIKEFWLNMFFINNEISRLWAKSYIIHKAYVLCGNRSHTYNIKRSLNALCMYCNFNPKKSKIFYISNTLFYISACISTSFSCLVYCKYVHYIRFNLMLPLVKQMLIFGIYSMEIKC